MLDPLPTRLPPQPWHPAVPCGCRVMGADPPVCPPPPVHQGSVRPYPGPAHRHPPDRHQLRPLPGGARLLRGELQGGHFAAPRQQGGGYWGHPGEGAGDTQGHPTAKEGSGEILGRVLGRPQGPCGKGGCQGHCGEGVGDTSGMWQGDTAGTLWPGRVLGTPRAPHPGAPDGKTGAVTGW